jgi:hypothetical protein
MPKINNNLENMDDCVIPLREAAPARLPAGRWHTPCSYLS